MKIPISVLRANTIRIYFIRANLNVYTITIWDFRFKCTNGFVPNTPRDIRISNYTNYILIVNKILSLPKTNYIYNFNVCEYCVVVANSLKTIKSWEFNGENYPTRLVKLVCRNLERIETDGVLNQLYLKELICDNVKYLEAQCIRKNLCLSDIRCHKAQQISKHAFYAWKAIKSVKSLSCKPGKEVL